MTIDRRTDKGCVVIVEQDELIRRLLIRWLCEAGYEPVLEPAPGLRVLLVVADTPHPRQAESVVRELHERYRAPVLATSGRFRRDVAASGDAARCIGVRRLLPKPFTRDEFLTAVEQSLHPE